MHALNPDYGINALNITVPAAIIVPGVITGFTPTYNSSSIYTVYAFYGFFNGTIQNATNGTILVVTGSDIFKLDSDIPGANITLGTIQRSTTAMSIIERSLTPPYLRLNATYAPDQNNQAQASYSIEILNTTVVNLGVEACRFGLLDPVNLTVTLFIYVKLAGDTTYRLEGQIQERIVNAGICEQVSIYNYFNVNQSISDMYYILNVAYEPVLVGYTYVYDPSTGQIVKAPDYDYENIRNITVYNVVDLGSAGSPGYNVYVQDSFEDVVPPRLVVEEPDLDTSYVGFIPVSIVVYDLGSGVANATLYVNGTLLDYVDGGNSSEVVLTGSVGAASGVVNITVDAFDGVGNRNITMILYQVKPFDLFNHTVSVESSRLELIGVDPALVTAGIVLLLILLGNAGTAAWLAAAASIVLAVLSTSGYVSVSPYAYSVLIVLSVLSIVTSRRGNP